jgi:SAM-dependent methyltransferase
MLDAVLPRVVEGFTTGAGVPYSAYAQVAGSALGETWRRIYDEQLVDGFVAAVPGLTEQLTAGARVLDLGCGTGHAVAVLAAAFPASTFTGIDIAPEAIARAEPPASNASYEVGDAAELTGSYDVIFAFDAIHDQRVPDVVLRRVHDALAPGGVFVMVDTKFSEDVATNVGNPYAPTAYATSLLFCVPLSLEAGGAALGAMWGTERAVRMLHDAGFGDVEMIDAPRPQNVIAVCRVDHSTDPEMDLRSGPPRA